MSRILLDTAIIVAIITALGTLLTAVLTEWYRSRLEERRTKDGA